jgi:hypothetical protein
MQLGAGVAESWPAASKKEKGDGTQVGYKTGFSAKNKGLRLLPQAQLPGQDSNLDKENQKTFRSQSNLLPLNSSSKKNAPLAPQLAPGPENRAPSVEPDLALVLSAWPFLPGPIRQAILALVQSGQ